MDTELFKWSISQGALAVVLLVVFWKYRGDLTQVLKQKGDETAILTKLVTDNTAALTKTAATHEGLRGDVHELAHEIRRLADVRPSQRRE